MKILHVLYSGLGGHGNVFFSMVNADTTSVFEYEALFNGVEELRTEYIERCKAHGIKWNFVKKKQGLDTEFYKNLVASIKKSDADIIFLHGSTQVLWARLGISLGQKKRRLVVRETQSNGLKTKQDWIWLTAALFLSNKIVFLTAAYQQEIRKKLSWVYTEKRTAVIANGIELEKFKSSVKLHDGKLVIGMQSRIVKIKDHATLLRAFALLLKDTDIPMQNIFLKIAGDGDNRKPMEELAAELGIANKVIFTGMITENELVHFLDGLDIYIHASFGETMSTAIMQAMAFKKPVIASNVPGINNMIDDGATGILVPVLDVQAMYTAMKKLIQNPATISKLSANARAYAETHFSNQAMFEKYKILFTSP